MNYLIEPDEDIDRSVLLLLKDPVGDELADGADDEEPDHGDNHPQFRVPGKPEDVRTRHCVVTCREP